MERLGGRTFSSSRRFLFCSETRARYRRLERGDHRQSLAVVRSARIVDQGADDELVAQGHPRQRGSTQFLELGGGDLLLVDVHHGGSGDGFAEAKVPGEKRLSVFPEDDLGQASAELGVELSDELRVLREAAGDVVETDPVDRMDVLEALLLVAEEQRSALGQEVTAISASVSCVSACCSRRYWFATSTAA